MGTTFALAAAHATSVELCLFGDEHDPNGPERRIPLPHRIHGVWFGHIPGVRPGQRYGYRVDGPWRPDQGLRHNPAKLLLDPYARAIEGSIRYVPEVYGHHVDDALVGDPAVRDDRDNAPFVPRSVVVGGADFDWGPDERSHEERRIPWADTVVYEAHVRGATRLMPQVPEELRGTYAGIGHPEFIAHLRRLGVTTLELLPVETFADEPGLARNGRSNYWGYNTLGFFAPHARYAACGDPVGAVAEFKEMVRSLHAAGIEVILDVVYNHTAEQSHAGPMLSWRGIDASTYYRLDERGNDIDVTGCGNTLDTRNATTLRMVLDSLRYWVQECHVDGFRFDLAVALARGRTDDYDRDHHFHMALRTDPVLSRVKLIAEPWDCGIHGWRTGQFPPPFGEWNDRFRDTVRSFWLGDLASSGPGHGVRELATRLAGSQDLFGTDDRGPLASLNYVASHDGFTLADTTAYEQKHNQPNGEDNRDGHGDNRSWNHGHEGPTTHEEIKRRRRRSMRNLLATTILATGTPMLLAGDELGRTQQGNNNAYCQDNETSWVQWELEPWQHDLLETTAYLLALRRDYRVLRQATFFSSHPHPGDGRADLLWFGRRGERMSWEAWEDPRARTLQMLLIGDDVSADSLLLIFSGKPAATTVRLPEFDEAPRTYELLWDSSWERPDPRGGGLVSAAQTVSVEATSLQVYRVLPPR